MFDIGLMYRRDSGRVWRWPSVRLEGKEEIHILERAANPKPRAMFLRDGRQERVYGGDDHADKLERNFLIALPSYATQI